MAREMPRPRAMTPPRATPSPLAASFPSFFPGVLALLAGFAMMPPLVASADESVTLDQFHPTETAEDGLEVSRPVDLDHHRFSAMATLEYAHNPLVYEVVTGNANTRLEDALVDHQLALHVGGAFGLTDRLTAFAGISSSLVMVGVDRPGHVGADGTRLGDVVLGGRMRLLGKPRLGEAPYGALAIQVGVTLPVAHWTSPTSHLTGESGVMVTPEVLAEVGGRKVRVTANAGARVRSREELEHFTVGPELTWGLGLGVPLVHGLELDVETYGATALGSNFMNRGSTPVEAIGGLRWRGGTGWTAALGAGPGLVGGYGSPDFRAVASMGWSQPPPPPPVVEEGITSVPASPDWDRDGIADSRDRCPRVPGPASNDGCALYVRLEPTELAPAEIVIVSRIEFDTSDSIVLRAGDAILEEIRAVLEVNPQLRRVAIEGHADERDTDDNNMALSQRRANAVMLWLTNHGVAPGRLEARGYGEREPFAAGTTPAAQQTNRNVQFFILRPAASSPSR